MSSPFKSNFPTMESSPANAYARTNTGASPLGGAAASSTITTPPRFNAGSGFPTSASSSGGKTGKLTSPLRGSARRERREKWAGRVGPAASPRSARQLTSPSSRASPSAAASARHTSSLSGSASRPFGLATTTAPPTAATGRAPSTGGTVTASTSTVTCTATAANSASAAPAALPPAYNMRQLLHSLVISTSTTITSTTAEQQPRRSPDSSVGSSTSDKENGSSSSLGFGSSSAHDESNLHPNPYALPNGAEMVENLIANLPRALNLHSTDGNDINMQETANDDDPLELDDIFYREMAEALLRCRIRKRSAPSSSSTAGSEPKRAEMSPARAAAHAAASARKQALREAEAATAAAATTTNTGGDSGESDSSWVDVDGNDDAAGAAAATAAAEEVSFRTARLAFETADATATTSSSAKVDKEAQFLGRMKIDDEDNDDDDNAAAHSASPEGIVASRVQRLGLDGGSRKKDDAGSARLTPNTTPASKQSRPFGTPAAASAAASRSAPVNNTTPATKVAASSSTPATKAAAAEGQAAEGGDSNTTPGTSKFSNLKGMWEGLSSPEPAAAAGSKVGAAAAKTEEEEEVPAAAASAANLTGPAAAEARAKEAFAKSKAAESAAGATPASNTDEHGFPSAHVDEAPFPSHDSDESFDLGDGLDDAGLPEMSFFHSPAEKVNAFSASEFAFDPPPATPEQQQQQDGTKIKPLKKPPHTNAKQGKMRRKNMAPSAVPGAAAAPAVGAAVTVGAEGGQGTEGVGGVDPSVFHFSVDLSKGKEGGARKQGKSKGQRASMVAPPAPVDTDVEMPDTSPPPPQPAGRPKASEEAAASAATAEAAAVNINPFFVQDFSIGASPRKSPRSRGGRKNKNKLPGFGTKAEAKPLAASMFRGGANASVNASFESTSGAMPFLDPFASAPAPAPAPVETAAPKPPSVPASAPNESQNAHIAALRDEGRELYLERRYQESVVRYTSALRIRTLNFTLAPSLGQNDMLLAQILGNRAAALLMVGAYDAAASDCRKGLEQIPESTIWDLKADSGPALRSRLLGRMGRALLKAGKVDAAEEAFDATIRIADETFAKYGREYIDPKAVNLLDQSIADATLNKTDARRLRDEKAEMNKYCSGLPPNVAAQRHGTQILSHVKIALELAPGDVELHSHTVQLLAYMKRWADLALHCERFASDCVKFDGVFVDDLASLNPYPSAPPAQTLTGDFFDLSVLDAATKAPKLLTEDAVGDAVRRMPISMLPLYLRALRLEERYAEAQRAASVLLACAQEGNLAGCPITWLEREQKKRIRTCTTKDTGDALFRKGQYDEAAAKYAACLLVDAEGEDIATTDGSNAGGRLHAVLHCNRAACFMATKQYREAAKECTAAMHIHTMYMKAMFRRARCHSRLQRHEEAVSEYQHWISLAEAAARNPQAAAAEYASACYFDKPIDTTPEDIEKARVELNEAMKAKASQAEADANARARAERQKWYDENLRGGSVGGATGAAASDAHRRKQQWYESAGSDGARRWDSFNGSSPKKPSGHAGRSYSHHRSPPRAQHNQQQQRSQSYRQQESAPSAPSEGNPKGRTHYEVLGVSRNATVAQIKKAYRKMALKHHPDKGGSDEDFLPVQQAYDCLSDEHARRRYDADLRYGRF